MMHLLLQATGIVLIERFEVTVKKPGFFVIHGFGKRHSKRNEKAAPLKREIVFETNIDCFENERNTWFPESRWICQA